MLDSDQSKQQTFAAEFEVKNDKGLHTRPSTELVKCAIPFNSEIMLECNGLSVSAKSLLGILTLAASKGTTIKVRATGEDAKAAVDAIRALAEGNFNMNF